MDSKTFNVLRTHHVEYRVTDLDRAQAFYVDAVGFTVTERGADGLYLRGLEDRTHHNLILRQASEPGVAHVGFRVSSENDLDVLGQYFGTLGVDVHWETGVERALGRVLRAQDPFGFPIEFFYQVDQVPWLLQRFDLYRGAEVMRLDHVNYISPHVEEAAHWYQDHLGFQMSEYTVSVENGKDRIWGAWLHRKQTSHDLAISNGKGPRFHHASFIASSKDQILAVADRLAALGYVDNIERGPGRHGTTNAFFLYLRDPDGNRIELFTGDYLLADPDWEPIRWDLEDPQRQTFWGAPAPKRWFDESMVTFDWNENPMPTTNPILPDRPIMVD
ncbi:MAG: 3,4-dihydroxyphenylacetate 2,3-dioxygenase [Firmicutes bacterium]|jgi:catechol 2,3-dioxygenase|nr:3,4-dihydroxyphenylacetate 2,3-dioxygenase [Bacillota bacterium]